MGKLKVGMIGCGGIGNWHLSHLVQFDDIEFVGFCDIVIEKAEAMVKQTGSGKAYKCYKEFLDDAKPEAVYICVPPNAHGDIEFDIISRGIPFLVEKPMALDIKLAEKIEKAVADKGLITAIGFQDRYLDVTDKIKEYIAGKEIGLISGAWVGGIPGVMWWRKRETSGGQIVEQNIHLFDMLRYLIGEPISVYTAAGKGIVDPEESGVPGYDVEDYSSAVVTFENGTIANVFTGCYIKDGGGMQLGLNIYAKDATIEYSLRHGVKYHDAAKTEEFITKVDQGVTEDRTFLDAVKSGDSSKIRSPYSDAIKSLRFTLACNESIDTGKVIKL